MADVIGIEIEHVNFAADYKDPGVCRVPARIPGRPHAQPDVLCKRRDQVQGLFRPRHAPGAEKIATGHYARAMRHNPATGLHELLKGLDPSRTRATFAPPEPGAAVQDDVPRGRAAQDRGAPHCRRNWPAQCQEKDSTGICFIGERPFPRILNRYISHAPGPILDDRGASWASMWAELLHTGPAPGAGHWRA